MLESFFRLYLADLFCCTLGKRKALVYTYWDFDHDLTLRIFSTPTAHCSTSGCQPLANENHAGIVLVIKDTIKIHPNRNLLAIFKDARESAEIARQEAEKLESHINRSAL